MEEREAKRHRQGAARWNKELDQIRELTYDRSHSDTKKGTKTSQEKVESSLKAIASDQDMSRAKRTVMGRGKRSTDNPKREKKEMHTRREETVVYHRR